jgi:hypothetical protein
MSLRIYWREHAAIAQREFRLWSCEINIPSLDSHQRAMPFSGYHPLHPVVL